MNSKILIGGLLAGAAVGVAIGVLLSPATNQAVKQKIRKGARVLTDSFDRIENLKEKFNDAIEHPTR